MSTVNDTIICSDKPLFTPVEKAKDLNPVLTVSKALDMLLGKSYDLRNAPDKEFLEYSDRPKRRDFVQMQWRLKGDVIHIQIAWLYAAQYGDQGLDLSLLTAKPYGASLDIPLVSESFEDLDDCDPNDIAALKIYLDALAPTSKSFCSDTVYVEGRIVQEMWTQSWDLLFVEFKRGSDIYLKLSKDFCKKANDDDAHLLFMAGYNADFDYED